VSSIRESHRAKVNPTSASWPHLPADALRGPAGEFIEIVRPETEADPAALLIDFLVTSGSLLGPGPHVIADGARHTGRLFAVLVGDTSRARKGTARANVQRFFSTVDPGWAESRVMTGLTTGEGLIKAVCESDIVGPSLPYETWLLDIEPEFSRVLSTAAREGSTLSATLRQAWDQEHLQVMTRKEPLLAKKAHVSMIAHITVEEIQRKLDDVEIANGFANRFLFAAVSRAQILPSGGKPDEVELKKLAFKVNRRLTNARSFGRLERSPAAEKYWHKVYTQLAQTRDGNLIEAVTARAEAQILRLSILYAVLDGHKVIDEEHVKAAVAVWSYCADSARIIFGGSTGHPLALQLERAISRAGSAGLDREGMHAALGRHTKASRITDALKKLDADGKITQRQEPTGGRPRTVAVAREFGERKPEVPRFHLPSLTSLDSTENERAEMFPRSEFGLREAEIGRTHVPPLPLNTSHSSPQLRVAENRTQEANGDSPMIEGSSEEQACDPCAELKIRDEKSSSVEYVPTTTTLTTQELLDLPDTSNP
jgi:hypothetical protein